MQAVRADHDSGPHGLRAAVDVRELGAFDAPARVAEQLDDAEAVADAGAGLDRGVHEHAVEQRAPGGEEPGHAVLRLDRHVDALVFVVEDRAVHERRARRDDPLEHPEARELEDAGAHQGVGRQRVGAVGAPVHGEHAQAAAGEQHRRGRPRGARPDHERVVAHAALRRYRAR